MKNKAAKTLQSLRYSLYVIFHPFKGFWQLKREHKGNIGAAVSLVALMILVTIARGQFTGYLFNTSAPGSFNILSEIFSVSLMFVLWCVSNWCITTLVDGEGSFRDIVITTAFALAPMILINIPLIVFSNIIVLEEGAFYTLFDTAALLWTAGLLLIGIMTAHQFTMLKTIGTVLIALVGMVVIVFIFILLFSLIQQFVNFCILLFDEFSARYLSSR